MNRNSGFTIALILLLVFLCLCLCVAVICWGSIAWLNQLPDSFDVNWDSDQSWSFGETTPTPVVVRPAPQADEPAAETAVTPELSPRDSDQGEQTAPEGADSPPIVYIPEDTLKTLENAIVPINDLLDLAERLGGVPDIPETLPPPEHFYEVGDRQDFWVTNVDTNENAQIEAVLSYVTDHAYFWVEDGVSYDADELQALAETFENHIYPTDREFFGSEWTPGVDGDPHLYIILASDLGYSLAGYFSSADEYHPLAHEYSNAHETFMLNADNIDLGDEFTYGVLAHEFQHMIHWNQDRNESSWLNEGFSELAAFLNGYDVGGFDYSYAIDPDLQLNDWPNDSNATGPHYGASFLFVTYFLDRFGERATQAVVADQANGMISVDQVLADLNISDPLTGAPITADDVFIDWVVANYLLDGSVADGRFTYHNNPNAPQADEAKTLFECGPGMRTSDVRQYGVDYYRITCAGDTTIHFEGSIQTGVLPQDPYSGGYAFWSNKGDESDMTLTRYFDFREAGAPLTFSFWTWYDLEEDYDYLYLEASTDGETWEILQTPSGTAEDPSGNSYGWAYNGLSGEDGHWINEQIDLSRFAGQEVWLRFEYVTDAAVNGEGFLLDDVSVPEVGYFNDFEADSDDWEAAGFVRIQNVLPQTYRLALISIGDTTTVDYIPLAPDNTADIPISIGNGVDEVIFVVTGTTRYTRQPAAYRFEFRP